MLSKEYQEAFAKKIAMEARHMVEQTEIGKEIEEIREKCRHKWTPQSDPYGDLWFCEKCEDNTDCDPFRVPVHRLKKEDHKFTIKQLNKKYPQGWWIK